VLQIATEPIAPKIDKIPIQLKPVSGVKKQQQHSPQQQGYLILGSISGSFLGIPTFCISMLPVFGPFKGCMPFYECMPIYGC
jgi:hypothetical protein